MADFGNPSYWDERYSADEEQYDWYQDFRTLEKYIAPYLKQSADFEILIPGCGNSRLGANLYDKGYSNLTNIDTSSVVINQMSNLYADRQDMEYTVMDARNMEFIPDQCFDLIIDKALFDTVLCSENNIIDVEALLREMHRVLRVGGTYLVMSHGLPDNRLSYFKRFLSCNISVLSIPKVELKFSDEDEASRFHYMYVITKPAN